MSEELKPTDVEAATTEAPTTEAVGSEAVEAIDTKASDTVTAAAQTPDAVADAIAADEAATADTLVIDRKIPGYDMAVMTIIIIIAILCIAIPIFMNMLNPQTEKPVQQSDKNQIASLQVTEFVKLPDGVAAIVNDVEIPEDRLNNYIEFYRSTLALEDEESWAQFINDGYGNTEGLRTFVLELFINQELVRQAAAANNITVTDEELQAKLQEEMASYSIENEDDFWIFVTRSGISEDEYKALMENEILQGKIIDLANPKSAYEDQMDELILEYIKSSYPARANIESLDEVSNELKENSKAYVIYYLNLDAYNKFMDKYIAMSDIQVGRAPSDLSYSADTGALQFKELIQRFKTQMDLAQDSTAQQIQKD